MATQRISYVALEKMTPEMRAEMERCAHEGTPRPESTAVRAHVPACFWFFANSWNNVFRNGILDHAIKEVCRLYVSRAVVCEFCGNQRSIKGQQAGLQEAQQGTPPQAHCRRARLRSPQNPRRWRARRSRATRASTSSATRRVESPRSRPSSRRRTSRPSECNRARSGRVRA